MNYRPTFASDSQWNLIGTWFWKTVMRLTWPAASCLESLRAGGSLQAPPSSKQEPNTTEFTQACSSIVATERRRGRNLYPTWTTVSIARAAVSRARAIVSSGCPLGQHHSHGATEAFKRAWDPQIARALPGSTGHTRRAASGLRVRVSFQL